MAAIRKPKKLKLPKKPKASASNQVMQNYLDRVDAVNKKNKERLDAYNKAIKTRENLKAKIAKL